MRWFLSLFSVSPDNALFVGESKEFTQAKHE